MSGFCISLHKNNFEECLFNDVIPCTRENDLFTPSQPIKNEKKNSTAPLSAVETTRFTSRNHLWLHLIFNLPLAGRFFFLFLSFFTIAWTVVSNLPPRQSFHFQMWLLLQLSACLLLLIQVMQHLSQTFLRRCLWIIHTRNPLILHLQVQKQRVHTCCMVHLSHMMDSFWYCT